MARLNWEIIAPNLAEAREELQNLEARIAARDCPCDVEFQIAMQHAFHHLNFAWNIRNPPAERYAGLTQEEFEEWSKFPTDLMLDDD